MEKEKTEEMKKKSTIAIIVGIVIMILIAIVAIIVFYVNKSDTIGDDYFVSDGTKLVVNMDGDTASVSEGEQSPVAVHRVYYYSGDNINDMKIFFEYADDEQAKLADETMSDEYAEWAESKKVNGKYIVFKVKKLLYDGMTTSGIRRMMDDE